jgi:predicted SnoaL-like aldol condensation-catalyzing enzyme
MSVSEQYVDAVNAADGDTLLALFAEGAVLRHPVGTYTGHDELRGFYESVVFQGQAVTTLLSVEPVDDGELALLSATSRVSEPGAKPLHAADIFRLDDEGLITELQIFYR